MSDYRKTTIVARELNTTYHRVIGLIRFNKIPPPERDSSGDFIWTAEDVERAREALQAQANRRKAVTVG